MPRTQTRSVEAIDPARDAPTSLPFPKPLSILEGALSKTPFQRQDLLAWADDQVAPNLFGVKGIAKSISLYLADDDAADAKGTLIAMIAKNTRLAHLARSAEVSVKLFILHASTEGLGESPQRIGQFIHSGRAGTKSSAEKLCMPGQSETDDMSRRQDEWEREVETLDQKAVQKC